MEEKTNSIETLFEKAVTFSKTTIALLKLRTIDRSSDIVSSLVPRLCIMIIAFMFILILNIGIALWLGEVTGKIYYGFFIVSGFYLIAAIVLFLMRKSIKKQVSNFVISQTLN